MTRHIRQDGTGQDRTDIFEIMLSLFVVQYWLNSFFYPKYNKFGGGI